MFIFCLKSLVLLMLCNHLKFKEYKNFQTMHMKSCQHTLQLLKPSAKSVISAIRVESGTTIEIGRNIDFKLSGSSVRPA